MSILAQLEKNRHQRGACAIALIDPDTKYDDILLSMINLINECDFDIIFVGGSMISDNAYDKRLMFIKNNTNLPLIIFPGSSNGQKDQKFVRLTFKVSGAAFSL